MGEKANTAELYQKLNERVGKVILGKEDTVRNVLNTVDWKQSAKLGRMVVRKTEAIQNDRYNIVLNMQSTLIEPDPQTLSSPHYIEECITICTSLLDSAVRADSEKAVASPPHALSAETQGGS